MRSTASSAACRTISPTTSSSCARTPTWALARQAEAAEVLKRLQNAEGLKGFAAYNFGIALLEDNRRQDALAQLDRAGQVESRDEAVLAIRDKSNFVLGTLLVEDRAVRAREAILRPSPARRPVLELGAARFGMGGDGGRGLRARSRALDAVGRARNHRCRGAGSAARAAVRLRQARRARPRRAALCATRSNRSTTRSSASTPR